MVGRGLDDLVLGRVLGGWGWLCRGCWIRHEQRRVVVVGVVVVVMVGDVEPVLVGVGLWFGF